MILKSWKFKGFNNDMPQWVQEETSKRPGSPDLWVHTQRGEEPAKKGQWISVSLRGHIDIHDEKPDGVAKEIAAVIAVVATIASAFGIVIMLAM